MDFGLTLRMPDGREEKVSVSLTDDEEDLLGRYWQYSQELLESKWVRSGMHVSSTWTLRAQQGVTADSEQPPWESVIEFLHRFRPLGLQREPTSFGRTKNLLCRLIPHDQVMAFARSQQEMFSGRAMQKLVRVESNEVVLNAEDTLDNWLNAYEYHRDQDKKMLIDDLHKILPLKASIPLFLNLLVERARAVLNLAALVGLLLGKTHTIEVPSVEVPSRLPDGEGAR